jgi:uncharacterized protein YeaC (DUF1315 family)
MDNEEQLMASLDSDIIERFRRAIELGKWPDGRELSDEQRATCMKAVIIYEHANLPEQERTGYVPPKETPCKDPSDQAESEIKWVDKK